jgi:hypothetical protein
MIINLDSEEHVEYIINCEKRTKQTNRLHFIISRAFDALLTYLLANILAFTNTLAHTYTHTHTKYLIFVEGFHTFHNVINLFYEPIFRYTLFTFFFPLSRVFLSYACLCLSFYLQSIFSNIMPYIKLIHFSGKVYLI